jgi:hypothetical protein
MGKTLSVRARRRAAVIVAGVVAIAAPVAGQGPAAAQKASSSAKVPRTPDGRPDLQGNWLFATLTPLQRPDNLAGRTHLTDEEIAAIEERAGNRRETFGLFPDPSKYSFDKRTSLIVDPPDGKVPPMTPAGQKRQDILSARRKAVEHPEDLPIYERCIVGFNSGPPIIPGGYNQHIQVVQTRDYVVMHVEMVHEARIIPLDGRPHLPAQLRQWNGSSRARWDGDTLVITSSNFKDTTGTLMLDGNLARTGIGWSPDENLKLTERFTRLDHDRMIYEFTIDDPTVWAKPWTAAIPLTRTDNNLYEYACHEGNHDFGFILSGQRKLDKEAEAAKTGSEPTPR